MYCLKQNCSWQSNVNVPILMQMQPNLHSKRIGLTKKWIGTSNNTFSHVQWTMSVDAARVKAKILRVTGNCSTKKNNNMSLQ